MGVSGLVLTGRLPCVTGLRLNHVHVWLSRSNLGILKSDEVWASIAMNVISPDALNRYYNHTYILR